jgi:WhiB family redox-sensing transcriptional regulator
MTRTLITSEGQDYTTEDWRRHANCRTHNPELFFPVGTTGPAAHQTERAKSICFACPVMTECREWAIRKGEDSGVWGGMDEHERRAMKRRNRRGQGSYRA